MSSEVKLFITCCLFSAIIGAYTVVLVEQIRDHGSSCTVTYRHGNEVNVLIGRRD
jgi:hypothetical protein